MGNLSATQKAMLVEITNTVENFADKNLSLKAYAVTAEDKVSDMGAHGKGKALSSVGDLLQRIAALSDVRVQKKEGVSPGSSMPSLFSGQTMKMDNKVTKINGLVNEWTQVANDCRQTYNMGLGKYLLLKAEHAMGRKGMLEVGKVSGKNGNFVYVNAHAVGLSHKMNDFQAIGVRMHNYEDALAKLTSALTSAPTAPKAPKPLDVKPPEYQGD